MRTTTSSLLAAVVLALGACGSSKNDAKGTGSNGGSAPAPVPPKEAVYSAPLPELGETGAECADEAACQKRCEAKVSAACRQLADLRGAKPFYEGACKLGDGSACLDAAKGDAKLIARHFELDTASCEARDAEACERLAGYHLAKDEGGRPSADPAAAPALREKACRLGSDAACNKLPDAKKAELADVILGVALARCVRGYAASCYDAIRSAGDREAAVTARVRAETEAACEREVSAACWTAANLAEQAGDTKAADRLHRRVLDLGVAACEAGHWQSCWVTARAMAPEALFADNVPPINQRNADPVRAKALWLKICEGELKQKGGLADARDRACEQAKALGADVSKIWTPPAP